MKGFLEIIILIFNTMIKISSELNKKEKLDTRLDKTMKNFFKLKKLSKNGEQ